MTTYTWPNTRAMRPRGWSLYPAHNVRVARSALNQVTQTGTLPGARWLASMDWPDQRHAERAALEALINRLAGGEHRLALWDLACPRPRGTIALTGVTASAAAPFATSLTLSGCGAGATLLAGDRIGVPISTGWGQQLLEAAADCTANGSGVMTVPVHTQLRGSVAAGAAVVLDKPVARFIPAGGQPVAWPHSGGGISPGIAFDLEEVFE